MWFNSNGDAYPDLEIHKIPAIATWKKYGITPKTLGWLVRESPSIIRYRDCLNTYFKLYWSGEHLLQKIAESGDGTITKNEAVYVAVYAPNCTRGYILAHKDEQYSLSFREAKKEFGLPAYVFISRERN